MIDAVGIHLVTDLDQAHSRLSKARAVAGAPPSDRWYRLLRQLADQVADLPVEGLAVDVGIHWRARNLLVSSAAFFAAEAGDLEDQVSLLERMQHRDLIAEIDEIVAVTTRAAAALVKGAEGEAWLELAALGGSPDILGAWNELRGLRSSLISDRTSPPDSMKSAANTAEITRRKRQASSVVKRNDRRPPSRPKAAAFGTTRRPAKRSAELVRRHGVRARLVAAAVLVAGIVAAAGIYVDANGTPIDDAAQVVVLVAASTNEPPPSLSPAVMDLLRHEVTDARRIEVDVTSAEGSVLTSLVLATQQEDATLRQVTEAVARAPISANGIDLLQAIDHAVRGQRPGTLVVVSSGLSTNGPFDLRKVGWDADPNSVVDTLRTDGNLPPLTNWQVVFASLGSTAGSQAPLPQQVRAQLVAYWQKIAEGAHASSVVIDKAVPSPPSTVSALASGAPTVPVPGVMTTVGQGGLQSTTFSDSVLGFTGDSADISSGAEALLRTVSQQLKTDLAREPGLLRVTVSGYTADPPDSTPASRRKLSQARAQAVADVFVANGVPQDKIQIIGGGTPPDPPTAVINGQFDGALAAKMRRVEISW